METNFQILKIDCSYYYIFDQKQLLLAWNSSLSLVEAMDYATINKKMRKYN